MCQRLGDLIPTRVIDAGAHLARMHWRHVYARRRCAGDEDIEITPEKMNTLITAAKIKDYEPIWATIFAKALKGVRIFALLEQEIYEEYDSSITHQWWFDGIISPGDDERRRGREYGPVVEAVPQRRRRGSEVDDDDEAGSSCSICGI